VSRQRKVRFGIIGCGLMGREFASAAARFCHLPDLAAAPEIVAVASGRIESTRWFSESLGSVRLATTDYREVLASPEVEAVYAAVPHHLHEEVCCAAIDAGKSMMAEKPFGIDRRANRAILDRIAAHPGPLVRCSTQFAFYPGAQRIGEMAEREAFGRIIEVEAGFLHSSDLDPRKPINWKRRVETNGEYGCMGDLGLHVCFLPLRAGWMPRDVRAVLSKIVSERPDGRGGMAPCTTWDNATLFCEARDAAGAPFPLTFKMCRISPGQKNTWYLRVLGAKASARFSTASPNRIELLEYSGGEQSWRTVEVGHRTAYKSITGEIFEFGSSDAILQMWGAFLHELAGGRPPGRFASCATPEEAARTHDLFTAALESHRERRVVELP
jgi:predicted dehydrogenase